jgi:hypothetical protein
MSDEGEKNGFYSSNLFKEPLKVHQPLLQKASLSPLSAVCGSKTDFAVVNNGILWNYQKNIPG